MAPIFAPPSARSSRGSARPRSWTTPEVADLLRGALDAVAARAGLGAKDVYLWARCVLPEEVWQPMRSGAAATSSRGPTGLLPTGAAAGGDGRDLACADLATVAASRALVGASAAERERACSSPKGRSAGLRAASARSPAAPSEAPGAGPPPAAAREERSPMGRCLPLPAASGTVECEGPGGEPRARGLFAEGLARPARGGAAAAAAAAPARGTPGLLPAGGDGRDLACADLATVAASRALVGAPWAERERACSGSPKAPGRRPGPWSSPGAPPDDRGRAAALATGPTPSPAASGSAAAREELWWPGGRCFQRSSASSAAADEESCRGERPAFPPLPAGAPAASALSPTSSWVELGLAAPSASATPVPYSPGARSASAAAPSEASHCAGAAGRGAAGPLRASLVAWMDPFGDGEDLGLSPAELAGWLRTLPSSKVPQDTRRALASHVLQHEIAGAQFEEMVTGGRWAELALADEREAVALARLFRQSRREAALATAARRNGQLNAASPAGRGEMLVA